MHRKKSSASNPPYVDGKHNMTSLQLCEGDDLATMMTVDTVLGFTTHKMDKNYNPLLIDKKVREKWKETMQEFANDLNYENAYLQLIASDKIKSTLKKDERFKRHIFRFLYLFDKRSGIEVSPCYRYENEGRKGAAIFATKEWEKGSQISTLFGCIAEMTPEEEEVFHESKNEFSVMYSTRKNCSQLWLGPAAYVNHDCKPNCRFTEGNDDSKMTLETLRDIHPGDELLIFYGNNFFGTDNAECECFTCELCDKGLFSRHFQGGVTGPGAPLRDPGRRQIVTRSSRASAAVTNPPAVPPQLSLHGGPSRSSYSLRATYSRIDRLKRRLQARQPPPGPPRQQQKLTITLRKSGGDHYEQVAPGNRRADSANIFSRLSALYGRPDPLPEAPPFLSPWFCCQAVAKAVVRRRRPPAAAAVVRRLRSRRRPPAGAAETSSSDMPTCEAASPAIPVLEAESDPECVPPPPPRLVCELLEPDLPNSPNKGIVIKFSRLAPS